MIIKDIIDIVDVDGDGIITKVILILLLLLLWNYNYEGGVCQACHGEWLHCKHQDGLNREEMSSSAWSVNQRI